MENKLDKSQYLEIYKKAHNNAHDLLLEANLLSDHGHFARAYTLAFTALEEISKSQFAADVFTGLESGENFERFYKNHKEKLSRVGWAHYDASTTPYNLKWVGPGPDDVEKLDVKAPLFQKRQESLYLSIDFINAKITKPEEAITEDDAKEIIHIVEIAFHRIVEVTEFMGHQIGTKGFMK